MSVNYLHSANLHTLEGPRAALPILFSDRRPYSILDIGCGTGTWLRTAMDSGIEDVVGIDGVDIRQEQLLIPPEKFLCRDLSTPVELGRRFDCAFCLEVAEHLDAAAGNAIIQTLTNHTDRIFFSAACPGQPGQHHVNCRWPDYWQRLFNQRGFVCSDEPRWRIWEVAAVEPWYRQNLFVGQRDETRAGSEPRIRSVLHPDLWRLNQPARANGFENHLTQIEAGRMKVGWYLALPGRALAQKVKRRLSRSSP